MFERLKQLIAEIKENTNISAEDKKGILKVTEYLLTRNDMDEKFNNTEKTLLEMWEFIKDEAREKATNGVAILDDEEVYSIAIHYFDESNESLGIGKETKSKKKHTSGDKTQKQSKEEITVEKTAEQDAKVEENASSTKQDAQMQHNDDDIAMIYKGRTVTYKEVREGQIFAKG